MIKESQTLKCWGQNKNGQLGNGSKVDSSGAVSVEGVDGLRFSSLTAGERHNCATTLNGNVLCWGFNSAGQLGDGTTENATLPVYVLNIDHEIAMVNAGDSHTCGITYVGGVKCWGDNTYGQLGDGSTYRSAIPVITNGLGGTVVNLSGGGSHTCAVLADNSAQCWGHNQGGQLGDGTTFMRISPTYVTGLITPVSLLDGGATHTCAVTIYGAAVCWGSHANGQIGDGTNPWVLTPIEVSGLINPEFTINYLNGQPGSFFTIYGEDLPSGVTVTVKANNILLSPSTTTDPDGNLVILLDTTLAEPGSYVITVVVGKGYNLSFRLDDSAPYRPQEGSGVIYQIPGGIAMTFNEYLPFSSK
jgi:alpha-tubulin suppressor-like RCC1 family protein